MEIIDKKKFTVTALNADDKTFAVHVTVLAEITTIPIHPFYQAQVVALMS